MGAILNKYSGKEPAPELVPHVRNNRGLFVPDPFVPDSVSRSTSCSMRDLLRQEAADSPSFESPRIVQVQYRAVPQEQGGGFEGDTP